MIARTIALCIVLLSTGGAAALTAENAPEAIAFLRLRLVGGRIELVSYEIRPGHLKSHAQSGAGIRVSVLSSKREMLWQGTTKDPRTRVFEWEDANRPGQIRSLRVPAPDGVFIVRVPFLQEKEIVRFAQIQESGEKDRANSEIGAFELKSR